MRNQVEEKDAERQRGKERMGENNGCLGLNDIENWPLCTRQDHSPKTNGHTGD